MQAEEQTQTSTKVKPLGELLEYQDSSIVSRVLMKNNGGTVTLGFTPKLGSPLVAKDPTPRAKGAI